MTDDLEHLTDRLGQTLLASGNLASARWLFRSLLQLLAKGDPVAVEDLAAATGRPADEVRAALGALPDTEFDDDGHIVGNGITLRPTPHRFEVDGKQLYTWCALDTLIFPALLGRAARVESPSYGTRTPVHVRIEPDGVADVDPVTAVVSIVTPDAPPSIRAAFCNQVHFFVTAADAAPWLADHPGATVVPVGAAYELGRTFVDALQRSDHDGCC